MKTAIHALRLVGAGVQATRVGGGGSLLGPNVGVLLVADVPTSHRGTHVLGEARTVLAQVLGGFCGGDDRVSVVFGARTSRRRRWWRRGAGSRESSIKQRAGRAWGEGERAKRTLVQRVVGVGFEEEVLQSDHDGVEVEDGLPVFAQDVQAHVSFEVKVGVVDLRGARVSSGEVEEVGRREKGGERRRQGMGRVGG